MKKPTRNGAASGLGLALFQRAELVNGVLTETAFVMSENTQAQLDGGRLTAQEQKVIGYIGPARNGPTFELLLRLPFRSQSGIDSRFAGRLVKPY